MASGDQNRTFAAARVEPQEEETEAEDESVANAISTAGIKPRRAPNSFPYYTPFMAPYSYQTPRVLYKAGRGNRHLPPLGF